jgi:AcrR family transcriptional regulator
MTALNGKRRPGRPPAGSEDKRARILHEAVDVFARQGYGAASLATIAKRSGISQAGLLHHFGSKEGLYEAVLESLEQQYRLPTSEEQYPVPAHSTEPWDFLASWIRLAELNALIPNRVPLTTSLVFSSLDPGHPAHEFLRTHWHGAIRGLVEGFEDGKKRGYIRSETPSAEVARAICAMSDGLQAQWLFAQGDDREEKIRLEPHFAAFFEMVKTTWGV